MSLGRANAAVALVLTLATAWAIARERGRVAAFVEAYRRFLFAPWKLVTFAVAEAGMILVAPLSGDPTWDRVDAATMGALTFLTAPFAVGVLFRCVRGRARWSHAVVALFCWLLSASWSYDFYILARDGFYPRSWGSNLIASSVLYVAAGMFWSLEHVEGRGVVFAFMLGEWPARGATRFARIATYAAIGMLFVVAVLSPFLWEAYTQLRGR